MATLGYSLLAFGVCLVAGLVWIRLAPMLGLLDVPGGRRQHLHIVPKVGGLALVTTVLLLARLPGLQVRTTPLESGAILAMAAIGVSDDRFDLRPRYKAGLGFILALALGLAGTNRLFPGLAPFPLLGLTIPPIPWVVFMLLGFMYLCIPQALNLIDGANGLATGFALVVIGCLWAAGDPHPFLVGALLACLALNWPKARLFLGDCGSLAIGLMLVVYAQKAFLLPNPNHLLWLFAYPAIDVITVTIIRKIHRRPIFEGDRAHLHFQLRDRWPGHARLVVPALLLAAFMCGSEVFTTGAWRALPYLGLTSLLALAGWFILATAFGPDLAVAPPICPVEPERVLPKPLSEPAPK